MQFKYEPRSIDVDLTRAKTVRFFNEEVTEGRFEISIVAQPTPANSASLRVTWYKNSTDTNGEVVFDFEGHTDGTAQVNSWVDFYTPDGEVESLNL
jgi:hypothetical protein